MSKVKKVVIVSDVHITQKTPKEYEVVKRFIKKQKPDEVIILGDYMDVEALSAWDFDKRKLMEGRRYKKEAENTNKELDFLQKHSKKVTYVFGNHENRVNRYIDKNPEMEGILEPELVLRLDERGIKYFQYGEMYKVGHMYFTHGFYTNKYHTAKHLEKFGCNICYGHIHNVQAFQTNALMQKPLMAYSMGCLSSLNPEWMRGMPTSWINSFGVMYSNTETGDFNLYQVNLIDGKFMFEGKIWD